MNSDNRDHRPLKLKTYRAWTMAEALAFVKEDLGADAVILHTRTFERGGFLGFGRRPVVELTAARAEDMQPDSPQRGRANERSDQRPARAPAQSVTENLQMSAAVRAYGAQANAAPRATPSAAPGIAAGASAPSDGLLTERELVIEREKTRRLAQAMAVQLEKQGLLGDAALENERATMREREQVQASARPSVAGAQQGAGAVGSAASTGLSPTHPLPSTGAVAQRFVLVAAPAAAGTKGGLVAQLATQIPSSAASPTRAAQSAAPDAAPAVPAAAPSTAPVEAQPAFISISPSSSAKSEQKAAARAKQIGFFPATFASVEDLHAGEPALSAGPASVAAQAFVSVVSLDAGGLGTADVSASDDAAQVAQLAEVEGPSSEPEVVAHDETQATAETTAETTVESTEAVQPMQPAQPSAGHDVTSRAQHRSDGTQDLAAISDFVGRVLDGLARDGSARGVATAASAVPARALTPMKSPRMQSTVAAPASATRPPSAAVPVHPSVPSVSAGTDPARAAAGASHGRSELLERFYARLIEQEVAAELADRILAGVAADLSAAIDAGAEPSERVVREAIERRIAALLPADATDGIASATGRVLPGRHGARRVAFIGPTGVGKTTTLAKIAAQLKLKRGLSVGIVAADTYRIAAVDQLRTYAEILELPVEVASSPSEAGRACDRLAEVHGVDIILIDTAGRSQNDRMRLSELRAFLQSAAPDETHLVLSATASARTLEREAVSFGAVGVDRIVLTKLDEAATFGTLLALVERIGARVSFFTHGQEVPDHIEVGRARRLAELVMGSEVR